MKTIKLKELEDSIKENYLKRKHIIERFEQKLQSRNMKKGRVRPRSESEAKILSMFSKK